MIKVNIVTQISSCSECKFCKYSGESFSESVYVCEKSSKEVDGDTDSRTPIPQSCPILIDQIRILELREDLRIVEKKLLKPHGYGKDTILEKLRILEEINTLS